MLHTIFQEVTPDRQVQCCSRTHPGNPQAAPKYYPSIKSTGRHSLRQLSKRIGVISTVSSVDTLAVLEALLTLVPRELSEGNIGQVGALGSFSRRPSGPRRGYRDGMAAHLW